MQINLFIDYRSYAHEFLWLQNTFVLPWCTLCARCLHLLVYKFRILSKYLLFTKYCIVRDCCLSHIICLWFPLSISLTESNAYNKHKCWSRSVCVMLWQCIVSPQSVKNSSDRYANDTSLLTLWCTLCMLAGVMQAITLNA